MFDETHILRLLLIIRSTKNNAKLQQKAFQCTRNLIYTHQNLITRIIDADSSILTEFMQSISECEQILTETLDKAHYKVSVSCGRLLYTIARIALSRQTHNPSAMDVDTPGVLQIRQMVTVVIETISKVEIGLEHSKKNTDQVYLGRVSKRTW